MPSPGEPDDHFAQETAACNTDTPSLQESTLSLQRFIYDRLKSVCHKCGATLLPHFTAGDCAMRWHSSSGNIGASICVHQCSSCDARTCIGCGKKPNADAPKNSDGTYLTWCCTGGALFTMWVILVRFDQFTAEWDLHENAFKSAPGQTVIAHAQPRSKTALKGVGYGHALPSHDRPQNFYKQPTHAQPAVYQIGDQNVDFAILGTLNLIRDLLPSPRRQTMPTPLFGMFFFSSILEKIGELLRNDSIENVTERYLVYHQSIYLCQYFAGHEHLRISYHRPTSKIPDLFRNEVQTSSVASSLVNLAKQATLILHNRKSSAFADTTGDFMLHLCKEIFQLQETITSDGTSPSSISIPPREMTAKEQWSEFHKAECLTHEDSIKGEFHGDLLQLAAETSHSAPGRMKRLYTEIANMTTSLPLGVFVKVDGSRPDMMKALIVGPEDTPYAFGLFEFDIFAPAAYPMVPPKVKMRMPSTPVQINPNVYPDGHVCLSLLGTFSSFGNPSAEWQPGKSTILAVLVSIQAMIFCEDPWRNEPSSGSDMSPTAMKRAKDYCLRRRPMTAKYFILDWLTRVNNTHARGSYQQKHVWEDIAVQHFRISRNMIWDKLGHWSEESSLIRRWDGVLDSAGISRAPGFSRNTRRDLEAEIMKELAQL